MLETFSNQHVPVESLPDFREIPLSPIARQYVAYSILKTATTWLLLTAASAMPAVLPFIENKPGLWLVVPVAMAALYFIVLDWIDARNRSWALREHDLVYSYGVLWRHTVIVPFARIQHVESSSGPLERRFGLMRFKCFTAGGALADLTVKGLTVASAEQARHFLLEQIRDDAAPVEEFDATH